MIVGLQQPKPLIGVEREHLSERRERAPSGHAASSSHLKTTFAAASSMG